MIIIKSNHGMCSLLQDELLARKEDIAREIELCKMEQEKAVRALKFIDEFYRDKCTAM